VSSAEDFVDTPAPLAVLVDNHRAFLAYLERRVGDRALAEDILQDAFVRLADRPDQAPAEEAIVPWFYRVLRNAAVDQFRRRGAAARALESFARELDNQACGRVRDGNRDLRLHNGNRRVAIEATVAGRDLGSTADEVRRRLASDFHPPTGYFVQVGGRVEQQERATQSLTVAIAAALVAVFALLYLALGSFAETAVILATIPSAFVGGILALLLLGETWNVSSLVGLIGLFGIAVRTAWCWWHRLARSSKRDGHFAPRCARPASAVFARS
jgi:RNA polymerase sigma factor (sigma-70 family)